MVKKGHAYLKIRGHRSFVCIGKIKTRQKGFQVHIEKLIQRVGASYSFKIAAVLAISIHTARGLQHFVGVELLLHFRREIGTETKISLLKVERRTSRKLLGVAQRSSQSPRPSAR